jgi:CRISPR-associated endonuclease Cas1
MDADDGTDVAGPPSPVENVRALISPEDVADLAIVRTEAYAATGLGDVVVVDGYGVVVAVRRGCLLLSDGVGDRRRTRTIARAAAGREVRRVLVLGTGAVSTEAMRWCHDQRLPLIVAKPGDAEPYMFGAPVLFDHGGLRRAQSVATLTSAGMEVVRWLLGLRLADQARIATALFDRQDVAAAIEAEREALGGCTTVEDAMTVEARAADYYWLAWGLLEVAIAAKDRARVPDHWRRFGGRRSPLTVEQSNRHAGDVVNALLNFGSWCCQTEAAIACLAVGLDPSLGFAHATRQSRPAAALDLMEAGRGVVEETVVQLVRSRTFRKASFVEAPSGEVRLMAPLSHELAQVLSPLLRDALGPVAERMASMIAASADAGINVPTSLTGARRGKRVRPRRARFAPSCRGCGKPLPLGQAHRSWCPECLPAARTERDLGAVGPARRRRRPPRRDYASTSDELRAQTMTARMAEQQAWEQARRGMPRPKPEEFEPIRAGLAGVTLTVIADAIGVSRTAASKIRSGQLAPHVRHWPALAELAGLRPTVGSPDRAAPGRVR